MIAKRRRHAFAAAALALQLTGSCSPAPAPSVVDDGKDAAALKRVAATYAELMSEVAASVSSGGAPTERMRSLETRLSDEARPVSRSLMAAVEHDEQESADAAAYALKYAADPDAAVSSLLKSLNRLDGKLINNIGLTLQYLAIEHPTLNIPMAPLTAALHEKVWNNQQKVAQAIEVLVQHRGVTDADGALAEALIPMLASQRPRVFEPARVLLPIISLRPLGTSPEPWAMWFEETYHRKINLVDGIYELVQIVHPLLGTAEQYRVEGTTYSRAALFRRLKIDGELAGKLTRKFAVQLQMPMGFPADAIRPLAEGILKDTPAYTVTFGPENENFVPFSVAVANLERLLGKK